MGNLKKYWKYILIGLVFVFLICFLASETFRYICIGTITIGITVGVPVIMILCGLVLYILPILIAYKKNHKDKTGITLLTLLLGWCGIAWAIALIWAITEDAKKDEFENYIRNVKIDD